MNLESAKELFEEIVELCYESNNPRFIEVIEEIYSEVEQAKTLSKIALSLEELQIAINEEDILSEEEDAVKEMQKKIEKLSE